MTDKELLTFAAKAAGIEHGADRLDCGLSITLPDGRHYSLPRWNPLVDDGDALRLAVKVGQLYVIRIEIGRSGADVEFDAHIAEAFSRGDDIAACTRRAIVRAAAEIGRKCD